MSYKPRLHEEQQYVLDIAKELEIPLEIIHHKRTTATCEEKLELLKENPEYRDWTLDRVVQALYFSNSHNGFIGVIKPKSISRIDSKELFHRVLGISNSQAERYKIDHSHTPTGRRLGTCSPFPLCSIVDKEISHLIVINMPEVNDKLVDISIGGSGTESYSTSMHLPYGGIYRILSTKFEEQAHLTLFKHLR